MSEKHNAADLVSKALRRAWRLGQDYWQYANSEFPSHWEKGDATQATFNQLVEDTRAALTSNSGAQPAPSVPDGWKLVPVEPTSEMLDKGSDQSFGYVSIALDVWVAMLAAAPEAKP